MVWVTLYAQKVFLIVSNVNMIILIAIQNAHYAKMIMLYPLMKINVY